MSLVRSAAQILADVEASGGDPEEPVAPATARAEREQRRAEMVDQIRELVGQKLTDRQIAARLGVSRETVEKHRRAHGIPPGLGRVGRPAGSRGRW